MIVEKAGEEIISIRKQHLLVMQLLIARRLEHLEAIPHPTLDLAPEPRPGAVANEHAPRDEGLLAVVAAKRLPDLEGKIDITHEKRGRLHEGEK